MARSRVWMDRGIRALRDAQVVQTGGPVAPWRAVDVWIDRGTITELCGMRRVVQTGGLVAVVRPLKHTRCAGVSCDLRRARRRRCLPSGSRASEASRRENVPDEKGGSQVVCERRVRKSARGSYLRTSKVSWGRGACSCCDVVRPAVLTLGPRTTWRRGGRAQGLIFLEWRDRFQQPARPPRPPHPLKWEPEPPPTMPGRQFLGHPLLTSNLPRIRTECLR